MMPDYRDIDSLLLPDFPGSTQNIPQLDIGSEVHLYANDEVNNHFIVRIDHIDNDRVCGIVIGGYYCEADSSNDIPQGSSVSFSIEFTRQMIVRDYP